MQKDNLKNEKTNLEVSKPQIIPSHQHDLSPVRLSLAGYQKDKETSGVSVKLPLQIPSSREKTFLEAEQYSTSISATGGTIHHHGQSPSKNQTAPNSTQWSAVGTHGGQTQTSGQLFTNKTPLTFSSKLNRHSSLLDVMSGMAEGSGTPQSQVIQNNAGQPPNKKLKMEDASTVSPEIVTLRKCVSDHMVKEKSEIKENYIEHLTELFFLKNGWNMIDYPAWKKRPTPQLVQYLKSASLDSEDEEEPSPEKKGKILTTLPSVPPITPVATATTLPASVAALAQQGQGSPLNLPVATGAQTASTITPPILSTSTANVVTSVTAVTTTSTPKTIATPLLAKAVSELKPGIQSFKNSGSSLLPGHGHRNIKNLPSGAPKVHITRQTITFPESGALASQEAIVERAKQEAQVMQRVAELRKDGLWTSAKLPKVQEPSRQKAHWDYLLEEMQWLATDFIQERKWKKAAARKVARMVAKYHQELEQRELKAEKEEGMKLKKIASQMAKQVKEFWSNIEKVVQYKQQSRMEEKRKKALDLHLNFIVDQTEKYSTWLTESLAAGSTHGSESIHSTPEHSIAGDGEFQPEDDDSDDEETIEKAEEEIGMDEEETRKEIEELQKESELPIEELLRTLPAEILDKPASIHSSDEEMDEPKSTHEDMEFTGEGEDEADVEDTIAEQEKHEKRDYSSELLDLENEGEISLEELANKYAGAYDSDFEFPDSETDDETDENEEEAEDEESQDESVEEEVEEADPDEEKAEDVGLEFLMNPEKTVDAQEQSEDIEEKGPGKEITDIAAEAQRLQPKGYTLETTEVHTTVPFLLKHTLREYQHVGLDWLATMYTKKLNGILADEMGLGKTIQTIALLAHLACEKGIWGPHLIVVPTSVMLNWELEFKKWCPAFKILTYYGTQKERKLKRTGWTKTNAFHVCITSYKLVIQDHQSFRRKKWKYFILDEAQNIKNFKSQRWQTLLNFQSQRRLLLTGTPLQNSLMELWSLMHFLMPHVFQSHREFKEWFANPLTGMVEGSFEYNESLIKRLHKVLRPFLLRRLKKDVEQQMPKKYEHVVMCKLSKRQRFLYDDFMSQGKTKETLAGGHFMSVINILMQLRKVCNHPNLFDPRPIVSPFQTEGIVYSTASMVLKAFQHDPLREIDIHSLYPCLADMERDLPAFVAHRVKKLQTSHKLIEEIHSGPEPPPRPRKVKLKKVAVRSTSPLLQNGTSSVITASSNSRSSSPITLVKSAVSRASTPTPSHSVLPAPIKLGIVSQSQSISAAPPSNSSPLIITSSALSGASPATIQAKVLPPGFQGSATSLSSSQQMGSSQPITLQIQQTEQGTRFMIPTGQLNQLPGLIQIVQTSSGQQIIGGQTSQIHPVISTQNNTSSVLLVNGPPPITTIAGTTQGAVNVVSVTSSTKTTPVVQLPSGTSVSSSLKPIMRVSPLAAGSQTQAVTTSNSSLITSVKTTEGKTPLEVLDNHHSGLADVSTVSTLSTRSSSKREPTVLKKSKLFLEPLEVKRNTRLRDKLTFISELNKNHCEVKPIYGQDLCGAVSVLEDNERNSVDSRWKGQGLVHCHCVHRQTRKNRPEYYWYQTKTLSDIVHTPEQYLEELKDILNRYIFHTPPVRAPPIQMQVFHPPPYYLTNERRREIILNKEISPRAACLHNINSNMSVQFPELRLIQYDCGKLQTLDILLRQLKSDSHRVLIFTQMTRMLDVLEAFLNFHGHRYVRLDGTTRVEQRQFLMDKFNADRRIFCFILSTRSGGIGVNLTGADTVIFYDSDWNPTMDAQAQDRCHRIGQTKDVHIYRLICEKTIEENILKKANQKRMLGDMAIEGGNFTTAFFKENTIKELFDEPSGLEALAKEKENEQKVKEVVQETGSGDARRTGSPTIMSQYEQALCKAEDETDVIAADLVKAEQKAELAEFDENIPWDEKEAETKKESDEVSRLELELAMLEKELSPIERYAVNYMETTMEPETAEELALAEEDIEVSKKEWELSRLMALKQEEERRAELEEDEMLYTYTREDSSQVFISDFDQEEMPLWAPPTPPQDDNDVYIDQSIFYMYELNSMPESQLPHIYVKKEHKKVKVEAITTRRQKQRKEEQPRVPRSLFDRPTAALLKMRREAKLQKLKQGLMTKPTIRPPVTPLSNKPLMDQPHDPSPEWLIHEDWALLQTVQELLDLPLNLMVVIPAHIPNWDLVADVVNGCSRVYRSPKHCRQRYENVIIPREEGRILYDINPRKQTSKKTKGIYKTKNNRPMRTSQLYLQDSSSSVTMLYTLRFDSVKCIANKKQPALRQAPTNPTSKNPKHAAVLAENGISYDQPNTPVQVAAKRAERIQKEKKAAAAEQQLAAAQRATQQTQVTTSTTAAAPTVVNAQGVTQVQAQQLQPIVTAASATVMQAGALQKAVTAQGVTISRSVTGAGNIVVNTPGAGNISTSAFAAINKRISQTVVTNAGQSTTVALTGNLAHAVRTQRAAGAALTVQDIVAGQTQAQVTQILAQAQPRMTVAVSTPVTTNQTAQSATQKISTTTAVSGVTSVPQQLTQGSTVTKALTPQQITALRMSQTILKQQQPLRPPGPKLNLTPEGLRQQQLKRLQTQTAASGQKTVIAQQLVTTQTTAQGQKAGQLKTTVPTRTFTEADLVYLRQRQLHQQKAQVQVTQTGQTVVTQAQLQTAQIIAQQVQQVGQSAATSQTPVATLVKTVSAPVGSVPNVTIPVSTVNINVTSVPQKALGKATTVSQLQQQQQLKQIHLLQQRKALQQTQKVATLGQAQVGKAQIPLNAVQIIQQQKQLTPAITVQQLQQLAKQQPGGSQTTTIQQIIAHSSQPTIIAVTQSQPTAQMIAKVSLPATASASQVQMLNTSQSVAVTHVSQASTTPTVVTTLNMAGAAPSTASSIVRTVAITAPVSSESSTIHVTPISVSALAQQATLTQQTVLTPQTTLHQQTVLTQQSTPTQQATITQQNVVPQTNISHQVTIPHQTIITPQAALTQQPVISQQSALTPQTIITQQPIQTQQAKISALGHTSVVQNIVSTQGHQFQTSPTPQHISSSPQITVSATPLQVTQANIPPSPSPQTMQTPVASPVTPQPVMSPLPQTPSQQAPTVAAAVTQTQAQSQVRASPYPMRTTRKSQ